MSVPNHICQGDAIAFSARHLLGVGEAVHLSQVVIIRLLNRCIHPIRSKQRVSQRRRLVIGSVNSIACAREEGSYRYARSREPTRIRWYAGLVHITAYVSSPEAMRISSTELVLTLRQTNEMSYMLRVGQFLFYVLAAAGPEERTGMFRVQPVRDRSGGFPAFFTVDGSWTRAC